MGGPWSTGGGGLTDSLLGYANPEALTRAMPRRWYEIPLVGKSFRITFPSPSIAPDRPKCPTFLVQSSFPLLSSPLKQVHIILYNVVYY